MKVEIRELKPTPPPREVVVTMTIEEAIGVRNEAGGGYGNTIYDLYKQLSQLNLRRSNSD
jgi:hypothetical protein